ncbi:MAG: PAS domain-containing sensor histidine kinase [Armatimonadota bacterium]
MAFARRNPADDETGLIWKLENFLMQLQQAGVEIDLHEGMAPESKFDRMATAVEATLRQAQSALSIYTNLVRYMPGAMVVVDRQHRFMLANEMYLRLHQLREEDIVGATVREIIGDAHYQLAAPQLDRVFQGETIIFDTWYTYPDHDRYMHVFYFPVYQAGEARWAGIILIDITSQHESEEQERRLLNTIAHDLRAPATIIKGQMELLLESLAPHITSPVREHVAALQRALRRMSQMIDDLTEVSHLETGEIPLTREPIRLSVWLPDFLQRNREALEPARMQLDVPDDLPPVAADPRRLERVLLNLLDNAQKYSAPGTPIRINARQFDATALISVADQGQGIPPEEMPFIFDRFFRATHQRKGVGIGLGLYITKALIEAHGGRVWVESDVGKGSTFFFTLPFDTTRAR